MCPRCAPLGVLRAHDPTHLTASVNSGTGPNCRMHHGYMTLRGKKKTPPAQWFIDLTDPSRLRWWDGRAWTDHCAPISPDGPVSGTPDFPAQRVSAQVASAPVGTPVAKSTRAVSASTDDDPSDVLRRVQSEMVSANLDLPLDEQVEVVGEQYYPKEIRKLFGECGLPITPAGNVLEDEVCCLMPEPWNPHDPNAVAVMVGSVTFPRSLRSVITRDSSGTPSSGN
jgi:hypothetical protein